MKTKKLFKSLLSLALAVILTASVCVCGFSVSATETTDVTVNVIDGTVAAPYTGGGNHLTSKAGITGVLEGKTVARLIPQYAYDGRRQISVDARTITEGEIDYANAKTISLYIKNDLGDSIKWRMSDYADDDKKTTDVDESHTTNFSTGTAYWMVDTAKNTAKRYFYSSGNYIYIPKDFEGYIIYDLTTCTAEMLSAFLGCNFDHIFFWMDGFNENTIGNPFYYGDMNISTVKAETMVDTLVPTAVEEYVSLNPTTANIKSGLGVKTDDTYCIRYNQSNISVVDNEYIGPSFAIKRASANTTPAIETAIIKNDDAAKAYQAIIFKLKVDGSKMPLIKFNGHTKSKENYNQYNWITTDWTTINLITGKVETFSKRTSDVTISDNKFEGYLIAHINDNTKIPVSTKDLLEGETSKLTWESFITKYADDYTDLRLDLGAFATTEACTMNLGEIYAVNDLNAHLPYILPNDRRLNKPSSGNVHTYLINGVKSGDTLQYIDGGDLLGTSYKFTVSEADDKNAYEFKHYLFSADTSYLDYEALVYRFKISNNAYDSLSIKLGNMWWYVTAPYTTINTLNGAVRNYDANGEIKIEDDEFEGYVILDLKNVTINGANWNEFITNNDGKKIVSFFFNQNASETNTVAGRLNNFLWGESSVIRDLDAFMAELVPTEETDTNETVISDPESSRVYSYKVNDETASYERIDGGDVLGSAYKFTVSEEYDKSAFHFQPLMCVASEDLLNKDALVYRFKVTGGAVKSFSIKMYGMWWYVTAPYTTINTLNGAVRNYDAASEIKIEDDEFEGYVILDIDNMIIKHESYEGMSWNDMITKQLDTDNTNIWAWYFGYASEKNTVAGRLNGLLWGETSVVDNKNEFIKKVTASTLDGDANEDGKVDILDLVRMKKYIAGIKDTEINPFNVKLADDGSGLGGTDLTIVRKMLTVEGWKPVTNDIGMAIWGLSDFDAWDSKYGATYGYAEDLFNYAGAANIETMRVTDAAGSVGWIKLTDPFADNTTTEMTESALTQLDRRIEGYKKVGLWDSIVGFCSEEIRLQNNMSDEQYKIFTKYLSEKYPGKRIMAVLSIEEVIGSEAYDPDNGRTITPANYDTYQYTTDIAYDIYTSIDKEKYQGYNETLKTNLAGLDYKMWYMPKTFWWNKAEYDTEEFMLNHLNLLYELLQEETNPGGLWCYGWNSYLDENGEGQVGLGDITTKGDYSNLLARIAEIAKEIRAKN